MANLNKNPTALTKMRRAVGMSRTQLAAAVGISDRTIERWEQRRSDIGDADAASVLAVATALGCEVEKIFDTMPEIDMSKKYKHSPTRQKKSADTNLKKYRVEAGMSLNELSLITNVPLQAIAAYEAKRNDIKKASASVIFALSAALNVSFGDILE